MYLQAGNETTACTLPEGVRLSTRRLWLAVARGSMLYFEKRLHVKRMYTYCCSVQDRPREDKVRAKRPFSTRPNADKLSRRLLAALP